MARKEKSRYINNIEKDKILSHLKRSNYNLYLTLKVAFETGLRVSELQGYIDKCEYGMEGENVTVQTAKGGKERLIPVTETAIMAKELVRTLYTSWERALNREFGTTISFHDCRKTFVTNLASIIRNPFKLMTLMGWKSVDTAMEYIDMDVTKLTHFYKFGEEENGYDVNINYHEKYNEQQGEIELLQNKILQLQKELEYERNKSERD